MAQKQRNLVAIDPGKNHVGVAYFRDGQYAEGGVVSVDFGEGPTLFAKTAQEVCKWIARRVPEGEKLDVLCIEKMKAHRGRGEAHGDLIDLSTVSGGIFAQFDPMRTRLKYIPLDWTGGRAKKINHPRILSRLDPDELLTHERDSKRVLAGNQKELIDAIGIGLYALRRFM